MFANACTGAHAGIAWARRATSRIATTRAWWSRRSRRQLQAEQSFSEVLAVVDQPMGHVGKLRLVERLGGKLGAEDHLVVLPQSELGDAHRSVEDQEPHR